MDVNPYETRGQVLQHADSPTKPSTRSRKPRPQRPLVAGLQGAIFTPPPTLSSSPPPSPPEELVAPWSHQRASRGSSQGRGGREQQHLVQTPFVAPPLAPRAPPCPSTAQAKHFTGRFLPRKLPSRSWRERSDLR